MSIALSKTNIGIKYCVFSAFLTHITRTSQLVMETYAMGNRDVAAAMGNRDVALPTSYGTTRPKPPLNPFAAFHRNYCASDEYKDALLAMGATKAFGVPMRTNRAL